MSEQNYYEILILMVLSFGPLKPHRFTECLKSAYRDALWWMIDHGEVDWLANRKMAISEKGWIRLKEYLNE